MSGLAIVIPRDGPGTGPSLPAPLYSLGADDYAYRWEASRLGLNDLDHFNTWTDSVEGITMTGSTTNQFVHGAGDGAYIEFPAGLACGLGTTIDLGNVFTYLILIRRTGTVPNNFLRTDNWVGGVATNGTWQLSGNANLNVSTVTADTWIPIFVLADKTTPANVRVKVGAGAVTGPGSITGPNASYTDSLSMVFSAATTGTTNLASIVVWKRGLSDTEMASVRAAVVTGSPLL